MKQIKLSLYVNQCDLVFSIDLLKNQFVQVLKGLACIIHALSGLRGNKYKNIKQTAFGVRDSESKNGDSINGEVENGKNVPFPLICGMNP